MPNFRAVIFDSDGTLSDSSKGILASANAAFAEMGFPLLDMQTIRPWVGPPLQDSMVNRHGMTPEEAERAIAIYRREYSAGNCFLQRSYDGMVETLERLRAAGLKTAVASSKPTIFLEKILKGTNRWHLFDAVCGVDLNRLESSKTDLIAAAAAQLGLAPADCLMVGDRRFDIEGANALHMQSAGALYGYGTREELEQAGATYLIEHPSELLQIAGLD